MQSLIPCGTPKAAGGQRQERVDEDRSRTGLNSPLLSWMPGDVC
jgi:hypothetical protein